MKNSQSKGSLAHRQKFAETLRTLHAEVVACDAPDEMFMEAAETAEALIKQLKDKPRRVRVISAKLEEEIRMEGKKINYGELFDFSPLSGSANPVAPPLTILKEDDDTMVGQINFSAAYEGGPGLVHGGYIAAVFDELLGLTQSLTGKAGMTANLKVRYRNPCPLHTALRMKGRVHSIEGRKIITRGTMHAADQIVADAEATFIVLDRETFEGKLPDKA